MSPLVTPSVTSVAVDAGDAATVAVRVRNTSSRVNRYAVEVLGAPAAWTTVEPAVLPLLPGDEGEATLTFRPPRKPEPVAGQLPFGVKVSSIENPDEVSVEEGSVEVRPFGQLDVRPMPKNAPAKRGARYRVLVENYGNRAEKIEVTAADPDESLKFTVKPERLELGPGFAEVVRMKARPRKVAWTGAPQVRAFQVTASAASGQTRTEGAVLTQKPIASTGVITAVIALFALAALLGTQLLPLVLGHPTQAGNVINAVAGKPVVPNATASPGTGAATTPTPPTGGGHPTPPPSPSPNNPVASWGGNENGQLGAGSASTSCSPTTVAGLRGVKDLAAGGKHVLALKMDGSVWAWGNNSFGQLGTGSSTSSSVPVRVSGLPVIVAIAAGDSHSVALGADGSVWGWGRNFEGELGVSTPDHAMSPIRIAFFPLNRGRLPIPIPSFGAPRTAAASAPATAVAAGAFHTLVLTSDGFVWAMGANAQGQVGSGTAGGPVTIPVKVQGMTGVIAVAGGSNHSLALTSDGSIWAWGDNRFGQLGIDAPPGFVTRAPHFALAQTATPTRVYQATHFTAISAGGLHSLGLGQDGRVWAWGSGSSGQLGNGSTTGSRTPVQVRTPSSSTFVAVAAGGGHSLAVSSDGGVFAWGLDSSCQLGNGQNQNALAPVSVRVGFPVLRAAAGSDFSFALGR